ncbi:type I DNA topoisomerase [Candidatus Curtissbacteria bacterium]|nr:type I DNA topoisomerase [Candidatus Curtissbacteria bacterium]
MTVKNLVIVESPTKARTLSQYLGKDYQITASMGHIRDLPRGEFGVDVENGFEPKYVIPKEKIKAVNILAKTAEEAETIWLATDPDREGEAIAWNLLEVIKQKAKKKKAFDHKRVVFHEITKGAILEAFEKPRAMDSDLIEAQQARRVLDRLVGYKLSPLLWKKVKSGLSAGRVQSVALKIVVDREREIEAFKSQEYWNIDVEVSKETKENFVASLAKINDKKAEVKKRAIADEVTGDLEKASYEIADVKAKDAKKYPNPPFTTSTLQQSAATRLGYAPGKTMKVAQSLYEQGLITYMRTDSVNLSPGAVSATRKYVEDRFGKDYLPHGPRAYKAKSRLAQEAHEAIRPTNVQVTGDKLQVTNDEKKLYELIWRRMVVCQMAEAVVAETSVDVSAQGNEKYLLRATGQKVKFDGWYKVYEKYPITEQLLPNLEKGMKLNLNKVTPTQKFTEPPARFTEATLIKELEKNDIGRPSTYAPTISTLHNRNYIERLEARRIGPTPIGKTTVDFLVKYFPNIVDLTFTAGMEDELDEIAQGKEKMAPVMEKFWRDFEPLVAKVLEEAEKMKPETEETNEKCEKCGKPMVIRYGRFGKFMACSGFPECKNTKALTVDSGLTCPLCGGNIIMKRTKRGKPFWGCSNWPDCKFASWKKPDLPSNAKQTDE